MTSHDELEEAFEGEKVLQAAPEALDEGFTDPSARRVLLDVGLPRGLTDFMVFDPRLRGRVRTAAEALGEFEDVPAGRFDGLYHLGVAGSDLLLVDGRSGAVVLMDSQENLTPLSTGLDRFLEFLVHVQRALTSDYGSDLGYEERMRILDGIRADAIQHVREVDPAGYAGAEDTWEDMVRALVAAED
jgi:hypothetical protein